MSDDKKIKLEVIRRIRNEIVPSMITSIANYENFDVEAELCKILQEEIETEMIAAGHGTKEDRDQKIVNQIIEIANSEEFIRIYGKPFFFEDADAKEKKE